MGKTSLSIALARAIGGEIISADSMQVYRHMDIGSAKISQKEMAGIPHYLVDIMEPTEDFNIVLFQNLAKEAISRIRSHGAVPILVGGTGFYIQAVTRDIDFSQGGCEDHCREELEKLAAEKGSRYLHEILRRIDPASAESIHENNTRRIIRALEFYHQNGRPISGHNEEERLKSSPYDLKYFVLTAPREVLYRHIDERVDAMIAGGLADEVAALKKAGCRKGMTSMQGLGYKEILAYLDGEYDLEEAIRILKRDTRHFAKRQLTWFRREKDVIWIDKADFDYDSAKILQYLLTCISE